MKNCQTVVHLVNGKSVYGKPSPATDEEVNTFKTVMGDIMSSSGAWQVNVEGTDGHWKIFPKDSVLYVELQIHDN